MSDQLLYNYKAASARLGGVVSDSWLQEHKRELPHTQIGSKVAFSEAQLAEIIRMFAVNPSGKPVAADKPAVLPTPAKAVRDIRPRGANKRTA